MGLCSSCGNSKDKIKDKGSRICVHLQSAVHLPHDTTSPLLNGNSTSNRKLRISPADFSLLPSTQPTASLNKNRVTMANMNITNPLKGLVSKRRNRYKKDGFNLDLTYITDKIIAMGYPASSIEGVYRNHIDDVVKFLESKHEGHYYIYNLCSERCYDKAKFNNRVKIYPFDDHNPPKLELIKPFCQDVQQWLCADERNVAAVHCKAGKGRTGTMICCYLLHSGRCQTAEEALTHYASARTEDRKGVTIPSQVRYVTYYERLLREKLTYAPVSMYIKEIHLRPVPTFAGGQGSICFSISQQDLHSDDDHPAQKCTKLFKSPPYEVKKGMHNLTIMMKHCVPITGDIKLELYNRTKIRRKEKLLQFWFNTFFVAKDSAKSPGVPVAPGSGGLCCCGNLTGNGVAVSMCSNGCNGVPTPQNCRVPSNLCDKTFYLSLRKSELDIVNKKDKQHKVVSADFQLQLILKQLPAMETGESLYLTPVYGQDATDGMTSGTLRCSQQNTPSESSEPDSSDENNEEEDDEDEDGWDSGDSTYL